MSLRTPRVTPRGHAPCAQGDKQVRRVADTLHISQTEPMAAIPTPTLLHKMGLWTWSARLHRLVATQTATDQIM